MVATNCTNSHQYFYLCTFVSFVATNLIYSCPFVTFVAKGPQALPYCPIKIHENIFAGYHFVKDSEGHLHGNLKVICAVGGGHLSWENRIIDTQDKFLYTPGLRN